MTDQELLAYEREHHGDPYMSLLKAKGMQRVALQFWHLGAARKGGPGGPEEARRRLHERLFPSDSFILESKRMDETGKAPRRRLVSPDPRTKLAATLDPTAQMGFPRLLPDRTREIADGIGSARRGEQLSA